MQTVTRDIHTNTFYYTHYETSAGILTVLCSDKGIYRAYFAKNDELPENHVFVPHIPNTNLIFDGTPFQIKAWQAALQIPAGKTISYQELATQISYPKAFRAVANALGQNKIAYFIPCHRIVRTDGSLGGYKWGIEKKKALLEFEKF